MKIGMDKLLPPLSRGGVKVVATLARVDKVTREVSISSFSVSTWLNSTSAVTVDDKNASLRE